MDYNLEIEWFDQHLGQMLALLEEAGELDNTIIIITSDIGKGDIFESYPRFAGMLEFPGFNAQGVYNPAFGKESLKE